MDEPESSSLRWLVATDFAQTKTKDRKRIVGSHVTKMVNAERRRKNVKTYRGGPLLLAAKIPGPDKVTEITESHKVDNHHGDSGTHVSRPISYPAVCYKHGVFRCHLCGFHRLPSIALDSGRRDPFNSLPVQGLKVDRIVNWWFKNMVPHYDSSITTSLQLQSMYSYPYHALQLPSMLQNSVAVYALLFIGTSMCKIQECDPGFDLAAHLFRGKCIQMVNNALSNVDDAVNDETILLVVCLTFESLYRGDSLAYESHIQGLRRLVDLRGGLKALGFQDGLQYCVRRVDTLYAMATGTETYFIPPIDAKVFCGHFGAKEIGSIVFDFAGFTLASLPSGFAQTVPSSCKYFSKDFIELVHETCDAASSPAPTSHDQRQWFKINSLLGRLSAQPAPFLSPMGDIQRPLYFAFCIFIWKLRPRPAQMHAQAVIARTLLSVLNKTSISDGILWKGAYGELLLWIVSMGVVCSSDGRGSGIVKDEFLKLWYIVSDLLCLKTWAEVKSVLKKFLWMDPYDKAALQLWLDIKDMGLKIEKI